MKPETLLDGLCFPEGPRWRDGRLVALESVTDDDGKRYAVSAVAEGGVLDIVEPGEHGILYSVDRGVDGLVAAVDKIPRMNFNKLNLSERAQQFSPARFRQRVQALLHRLDDSREPGS